MNSNDNFLHISSKRAEKLINIYSNKSKMVNFFVNFYTKRKLLKKRLQKKVNGIFQKHKTKSEQLQILIHVRGGIGDVAITRGFLKKLRDILPQSEIYFSYDSETIVKTVLLDSTELIKGFVNKNKYIESDYDIVLSGSHVLIYKYVDLPRIKAIAPHFEPILKRGLEMSKIFKVFDDNTPYLDGYLADMTVRYGSNRAGNLLLSTGFDLNPSEHVPIALEGNSSDIISKYGLKDKKYITIHNGINNNTRIAGGYLTRNWPKKRWEEFVTIFKKEFPDIFIVQIGGNQAESFSFVDVSLNGKTSLSDTLYILDKSLLHIDGETGMVHLAYLVNTQSIVMFGPTLMPYFAYDVNVNIKSSKCTNCMNIDKYWASRCILGYKEEEGCMAAISVAEIFAHVKEKLNKSL